MKERISALMDGELGRQESAGAIGGLESGNEARETWRTYHLIGDAMRETRTLSPGFSDRVITKLGSEPAVLAPSRSLAGPVAMRWSALAASLAAAAFVGWVAFLPQEDVQSPAPRVASSVVLPAPGVQEAALVAPPDTANDYLLAHQGYSPRNSLQGAATYVRTVASDTRGGRR